MVILLLASSSGAFPPSRFSTGLDMTSLHWQDEDDVFWSFNFAWGPMIRRNVYLRARVSIPVPGFIIIGNQFKAGGELLWDVVQTNDGFGLSLSAGVHWCAMWPENIIVILADGDTGGEPVKQEAFEDASGTGFELLASPCLLMGPVRIVLDLGVEHRIVTVNEFTENGIRGFDRTFTGPHAGFSMSVDF